MSKLLLAIIGLILVVFVSANTETDNQNTDINLQNNLLIRDAREAGRKDKKGKKSKAKKKRKNKSKRKSKKRKAEKKRKKKSRKGKAERKTEGSKRRNGKKNKSKRRLKKKRKNDKNKISKRKGGKPMNGGRRRGNKDGNPGSLSSLASTTGPPPTPEMCIRDLQKAMNIWRTAANNFKNKQAKRIDRQLKVMKNKFDKSGAFAAVRASLIIVGGGNSKGLECQGSSTSTVAKSMTMLAEKLDKCNNNIKTDCDSQNLVDQKELEKCSVKAIKFEEEATKCNDDYKDGSEEACMCWDMLVNGNNRETMKNVSECSAFFQPVAKKVSDKNTKCKETFSACRGYEDTASIKISACLQNAADLSAKAKTLSENKDSMGKAQAKVNSLTGTGTNGTNGTNTTRRSRRSISTCVEFITAVKSLVNLSADDPSVAIFANKIANSTVTCNGTEVQQLVVLEVQVTELAADITIQFTAVQVVIQEATGSTVNPASVPSSTATKAARFRRFFDHLNRKMM